MLEFFYPVRSLSAEELRNMLNQRHPEDLVLLDVRQPLEYRAGHIVGALSIPVGELDGRLAELDPGRTVVVYCAAGVRSRAAAGMLLHQGFEDVFHLAGGFQSWQGHKATGQPELVSEDFGRVATPEQHVALAWLLEDGARRFYQELAERLEDPAMATLFRELAAVEGHHKQTLLAVYEGLTKQKPGENFPAGLLPGALDNELMEGGFRVGEALARAGSNAAQACETAMAVEINAYDHYLFLERSLADENSRRVFEVLAGEERWHLVRLSEAFEKLL